MKGIEPSSLGWKPNIRIHYTTPAKYTIQGRAKNTKPKKTNAEISGPSIVLLSLIPDPYKIALKISIIPISSDNKNHFIYYIFPQVPDTGFEPMTPA